MKLNMKVNELGIVVKSARGEQTGKIVKCVRLERNALFSNGRSANAWETDPPLHDTKGRATICPDEWLRPLRDSDGEDETLTWAGKPEGVTA